MKNFTQTERQKMYEYLLTLQCPDLLAALIAERVDAIYIFDMGCNVTNHEIQSWILDGFDWFLTPEEHDFWHNMHDCVCDFEASTQVEDEDYSDHGGGSVLEDYEVPTEADFTPVSYAVGDVVSSGGDLFVAIASSDSPKQPLSLFARVKLFFGKLFYGV